MTDPTIAAWSRENDLLFQLRQLREDKQSVDAVYTLTEEGWIWDGDQWQRPAQKECVNREPLEYWTVANGWVKIDEVREHMSNEDFEPIRVRIMQEAYELADRNDSEGYNAIKVMCSDVQTMLPSQRPWVGLTDEEIKEIWLTGIDRGDDWLDVQEIARAIEAKLKERNT
jgi:hypothetical protein